MPTDPHIVPTSRVITARTAAATGLTFFLVAVAKYALVALLLVIGVSRYSLRTQDAVITGALAATLVFLLRQASDTKKRQVAAQLRIVADLNHNVRNALEVIVGSEYLPEPAKMRAILDSVQRIEQTLHRIQLFIEERKSQF